MIRRPPGSTRTYTLFPSPPLFRSRPGLLRARARGAGLHVGAPGVADHGVAGGVPLAGVCRLPVGPVQLHHRPDRRQALRSEEHTSELQSLMRISYAVFCLKKKKHNTKSLTHSTTKI